MSANVVGVFGGSFDPPHLGHVLLACSALSSTDVERVIVAPTFQHAFGKVLAPFEDRLAMCERAFAPLRDVEISPLERELGATSRTLRLVRALAERHPGASLRLLLGSDLAEQTPQWQDFGEIAKLAPPLYFARGGHPAAPTSTEDHLEPILVLPEVSSSEVRARLGAGQPCGSLVPRAVLEYVARSHLYRE